MADNGKSSKTRVVLYNILIFFVLFNVVYWAIPTFSTTEGAVREYRRLAKRAPSELSALQRLAWMRRNWHAGQPPTEYRSHVGWRRTAWAADDVHIEGPYGQRRTINAGAPDNGRVYFFGGSTMWGFAIGDHETIPSQFAAKTGLHSENFGELGYTAHQSLLLLIQLLQEGHRPDLVVFYDGVNEVAMKCQNEHTPVSHAQEQRFKTIVSQSFSSDSFSHYFAPLLHVATHINRELGRAIDREEYDCHRNPQKAEAIANNMIKDWEIAKHLVEAHGGKFVGFLQPVLQFSRTPSDHVDMAPVERRRASYQAVYPLLRERVGRLGGDFHDLISAVDVDEPIYIDWCHLTPKGNGHVVDRVVQILGSLGLRRQAAAR